MKSTDSELRRRGLCSQEDGKALEGASFEALLETLSRGEPPLRSAAAVLLRPHADTAAEKLLLQLEKERCLYTRIAITDTLAEGNLETARLMAGYLGRIGHNQHRVPPQRASAKKSFPLPRDLIARCFGRMKPAVYPALAEVMETGSMRQIYEAADAAGYLAFYHPVLASEDAGAQILSLAERFPEDLLLIWKVLLCLSAYPSAEGSAFLLKYAEDPTILGMEARRSLRILESRKG